MPEIVLAEPAEQDIRDILQHSLIGFGEQGAQRYQALISAGLKELRSDAEPLGSKPYRSNVRFYHLRHAKVRMDKLQGLVKQPRHLLFYKVINPDLLQVLRVLHEAMDPSLHLDPEK